MSSSSGAQAYRGLGLDILRFKRRKDGSCFRLNPKRVAQGENPGAPVTEITDVVSTSVEVRVGEIHSHCLRVNEAGWHHGI